MPQQTGSDPEPGASSTLYIVDDDAGVRDTLTHFLTPEGYRVVGFSDGTSFLAQAGTQFPACVLLDVCLPDMSGLDILKELNAHRYPAPILIVSGKADVAMAVEAIKHGAFDVIEKPFRLRSLADRVADAIAAAEAARRGTPANDAEWQFPGYDTLTPREREALAKIAAGMPNKRAAYELGISPRTMEVHRANIMHKLHAHNAADLMRIVLTPIRRNAASAGQPSGTKDPKDI